MTEPNETKKARRPATTDAGRQMLQRQRARLNREQARLGEKLVNEARHAAATGSMLAATTDPVHNAISRGIVRRVAGVLASEKVTPAINVRPADFGDGERMQAWTDFTSITVQYTPHNDKRLLAATMRGLMYHEGGHIRWTTPYATLLQQIINVTTGGAIYAEGYDADAHQWAWNALEDQRMETAVTSDSPRKSAYFTPMIMTELTETPMKAALNWPLLIWRRYLPKHIRRGARKAFVEMHGADGEALAKGFEAVTSKYVLATDFVTMWEAVREAVALYAQHSTAASLSNMAMGHQSHKSTPETNNEARRGEKLEIPIDPSMVDEDDDDDDEADSDVGAGEGDDIETEDDDAEGAGTGEPTEDDDEAAEALADDVEGGDDMPFDIEDMPEVEARAEAPGNSEVDGGEGDKPGDADDGDGGAGEGEGTDDDESDAEGGEGAGGAAGDHSKADEDKLTQDDIDQALDKANDRWLNDAAVDEDLQAYEEALNSGASQLPLYIGGISRDVAAAAVAENLADRIQQAFEMATMDRQPAWVEQQRRGIVNVNRYATRQAGDVEYFRNWIEDDQPGYNMAVSVLLDYSSSMSSNMKELAQCGYAAKLACDKLNIPCTVTLWDSKATTLFDANETPRGLPTISSAGSTDPSMALADLDNQRYDKETHLVLVMTDGQWNGEWNDRHHSKGGKAKRTVAFYAGHGRHFIGFGFSEYGSGSAERYAADMRKYGIRETYGITNLMEIPKRLQEAMIRLA